MDDVLAGIDCPDRRVVAGATVDDEHRPILLGVGQRTADDVRVDPRIHGAAHRDEFRAGPGTPTDQAWIETFFGHLKAEWPHLLTITEPKVLRAAA